MSRARRRFLLALALAAAAGAAVWHWEWVEREPAPLAVILVTIDTLRADHLGCYGYPRPTSPFLDRLARGGTLFENAYSSISHTTPAHATLFTGLYPAQHRVLRNGEGFARPGTGPPPFATLAELMAGAGYETAAFSGVGFLRTVSRGFATLSVSGDWSQYRQADAVVSDALQFVTKKRPGDRLFLWLHLFDPHPPDRAPADLLQRLGFASRAAEEAFGRAMRSARAIPDAYLRSPAELARSFVRYDAEVAFADRELGRLFDAMERTGFNDRALWVVTADHGEGLGSHGYGGHGIFVYNEQIRVPLIVYEHGRRGGTRVRDLVRLVDVLPTIAERVGFRFEPRGFTAPGRSLGPLLRASWWPRRGVRLVAQRRPPDGAERSFWERGDLFSIQDLDWKYVVHTEGKDELFDLRSDPLELRNLADGPSSVKEDLRRQAREAMASLAREGAQVRPVPFEPKTRDELRALGYIE
jgi:arylsulfatase A-like enzyme